jgi:hypothetical protein
LISSTITDWKDESGDKEVDEDDFTGNGDSVGDGGNNEPGVSGDSDTGTNNSGGSSNGNTSDGNNNGEGTGNGGGTSNGGDTEGNGGGTDNGGDTGGGSSNNSSFGYGVYTSNPDIWDSYGNNGKNSADNALYININETKYKGVRLASDEKPGEVTSSISKENSKMSFYAKGIKESTLTVSVTGAKLKNDDGTSTSKNIKLEKDSTQTYANATYTFTITDKDHYVFDLVDVTDDFKVTFRSEKGNVCFVWGVNYE